MNIAIVQPKDLKPADIAVVGVFQDRLADAKTPRQFLPFIREARRLQQKFGEKFKSTYLPSKDVLVARKGVLLIGLGQRKDCTPATIRNAAAVAMRQIRPEEPTAVTVFFQEERAVDPHLLVDGVLFGSYTHTYKTKEKEKRKPRQVVICATRNVGNLKETIAIAEAVNETRRLVDEPSNRMTPVVLAAEGLRIAKKHGLSGTIISEKEAKKMGMGAFAAVAAGSDEEGQVIVMRYAGDKKAPTIGLVGKGITFDSGGLSLKPAEIMEKMKLDMAGGASVLGIMRAVAELKPKTNVIGIVMAAENSPSGKAARPGDVVTALSGRTIEIVNTDAEGRLVVADGLTYAEKLGATHIVDLATLTGACMVALGQDIVGMMGKPQAFLERVKQAAEKADERIWQLPLDPDFAEQLKSPIADVKNIGGLFGGAITAGKFVELVIETKKPWVHLDIAGPAYEEKGKPWMEQGGTGVMVRTIVELIRRIDDRRH